MHTRVTTCQWWIIHSEWQVGLWLGWRFDGYQSMATVISQPIGSFHDVHTIFSPQPCFQQQFSKKMNRSSIPIVPPHVCGKIADIWNTWIWPLFKLICLFLIWQDVPWIKKNIQPTVFSIYLKLINHNVSTIYSTLFQKYPWSSMYEPFKSFNNAIFQHFPPLIHYLEDGWETPFVASIRTSP